MLWSVELFTIVYLLYSILTVLLMYWMCVKNSSNPLSKKVEMFMYFSFMDRSLFLFRCSCGEFGVNDISSGMFICGKFECF